MELLIQIATGLGMGVLIAVTTYATKFQKGEAFKWGKLLRTALIGAVLGGIAGYSNVPLTADNWQAYLAANAGVVAFIDQILKLIINKIRPPVPV